MEDMSVSGGSKQACKRALAINSAMESGEWCGSFGATRHIDSAATGVAAGVTAIGPSREVEKSDGGAAAAAAAAAARRP